MTRVSIEAPPYLNRPICFAWASGIDPMEIAAGIGLFNKGFHPSGIFATYQFDDTSTGKQELFSPEAYKYETES
jgi:hypothetical protein